jgi:hypothetical protein
MNTLLTPVQSLLSIESLSSGNLCAHHSLTPAGRAGWKDFPFGASCAETAAELRTAAG